jgi:hypothetical protein
MVRMSFSAKYFISVGIPIRETVQEARFLYDYCVCDITAGRFENQWNDNSNNKNNGRSNNFGRSPYYIFSLSNNVGVIDFDSFS